MKALPFCVIFLLLMLFSSVLFFPEQVSLLYAQNSTVSQLSSTATQYWSSIFFTVLNATASVSNTTSPIIANTSDTTQTLTTPTTTKTTSSGTSTRTSAVPYFVLNPSCRVDQSTHDLNCITKIAGIENIAKIRPFLHADLTTSCINPAGNMPPDQLR